MFSPPLVQFHAATSPEQEDMSLHCTMCHRSCETGSSSSLALTLCKIYLRCHKSPLPPLTGAGAKFSVVCRIVNSSSEMGAVGSAGQCLMPVHVLCEFSSPSNELWKLS